ncbi:MAG: glycosyltransferase [Pseudomonadota bacterium]
MNRRPWLSIIIPVCNRFDLLGRTLDSVLSQRAGNVEVIISDDGSKDSIEQFVEQYSGHGMKPRLVLSRSNNGVSAARNKGAKAARGKWLYFLDSDDELVPGALEKIQAATGCRDAKLIYFHAQSICGNGEVRFFDSQVLPDPLDRSELLTSEYRPFTQSQIAVHAASFNDIGRFDEQLSTGEDFEVWLRMIMHDFKIVHVADVLVRKHDGHGKSLSSDYQKLYDNRRRVWAKHRAALKRILRPNQYRRWEFAQLHSLYWLLCVEWHVASRLPGRGATAYLCYRWAMLAINPPDGRRKDVVRRLGSTVKHLVFGSSST